MGSPLRKIRKSFIKLIRERSRARKGKRRKGHYHLKAHVEFRDGGKCARCGVITDDWEMNHIFPVHAGGKEQALSNIETVCKSCHNNITRSQMKLLRRARKG
jgi:5-methylcytosine-specific restriction endonuclease McrA